MRAVTFFLLSAIVAGQELEFEVASIRPTKDDGDHDSSTDHGFYKTHNLTLKRLIGFAYRVDNRLILGGPGWIDADSYDINAKIPEAFAAKRDPDTVPQMIQSLLADRFQLVVHREPTEIAGYALVVVKKGAKLAAGDPNDKSSGTRTKNTHMTATNVTMANFAVNLSRNSDIGKLVVDRTGLTGSYSFELDWAPDKVASNPESRDDRPSILTALPEQLGLRLEPAKIPVQAIVIDRAEKPEGN
jgi:uncharacterized protein (TIGR03435 family)